MDRRRVGRTAADGNDQQLAIHQRCGGDSEEVLHEAELALGVYLPDQSAVLGAAALETIERLTAALEPDYVVLGGGNAKKLGELPANVRLGANENAFLGAFRLWDPTMPSLRPAEH